MTPRPYQFSLKQDIYGEWQKQKRNVLAVLPTGGGKTFTFASILHEQQGATCAIAHRKELVGQIATALGREGVYHKILAPLPTIKQIVHDQIEVLGRSYYNANAPCAVAGIDTLINRKEELKVWTPQVRLWVMDEAHHLLEKNKWGEGVEMFPNALGLGVTATPIRADGVGLGRGQGGVMDSLVEGPDMRWLIEEGYLTDYIIFCPETKLNLKDVTISSVTGDYVQPKLKKAVRESTIVGDVIEHYFRHTFGKLSVVFAVDVETATDFAREFNKAGVRAEVVSADTDARVRAEIIRKFRRREIMVLVNVDLFGEGFDLPSLESVSFARPTESYSLYCQQFGRALRPFYAEGFDLSTREGRLAAIAASIKPYAIIVDHVMNIHHGLPDAKKFWSLNARDRKTRSLADGIGLKPCPLCTRPYVKYLHTCPYCGYYPEPALRSGPEFVDGDLTMLDMEMLRALRGNVAEVDDPNIQLNRLKFAGAPQAAINGYMKNHRLRLEAQTALRASMEWWGGVHKAHGLDDQSAMKAFYLTFGVDVLSAQALGREDAFKLAERVNRHLGQRL